jgi:hypothetical protein
MGSGCLGKVCSSSSLLIKTWSFGMGRLGRGKYDTMMNR